MASFRGSPAIGEGIGSWLWVLGLKQIRLRQYGWMGKSCAWRAGFTQATLVAFLPCATATIQPGREVRPGQRRRVLMRGPGGEFEVPLREPFSADPPGARAATTRSAASARNRWLSVAFVTPAFKIRLRYPPKTNHPDEDMDRIVIVLCMQRSERRTPAFHCGQEHRAIYQAAAAGGTGGGEVAAAFA